MTNSLADTPAVDVVFAALGHPTRRAVIQRLTAGPATVSHLAQPFGIALPTLLQHLRVLEDAGLVRTTRQGRTRTCELVPEPLARAGDWLTTQRSAWERRLDQLDAYLLTMEDPA